MCGSVNGMFARETSWATQTMFTIAHLVLLRKCWHFLGKLTNTQTVKNYKCQIETLATSLKLSYGGTVYVTDSLIDTCV